MIVYTKQIDDSIKSPIFKNQWAVVKKTPELNKIIVLRNGIPKGKNIKLFKPIGGHVRFKFIEGNKELQKKVPKNAINSISSEKINHKKLNFIFNWTKLVWHPSKHPSLRMSRPQRNNISEKPIKLKNKKKIKKLMNCRPRKIDTINKNKFEDKKNGHQLKLTICQLWKVKNLFKKLVVLRTKKSSKWENICWHKS